MKVLFLDDEAWRHDSMDLMVRTTDSILHVYDTEEFTRALSRAPFDLVCFDHDLGLGETTGLQAAEQFVALKHPETLCLVHSWNPMGAEMIRRVLRAGGHRVAVLPFSTALIRFIEAL